MDVTCTILRLAHVDALRGITVFPKELDEIFDRFCIFKLHHFP